MSPDPRALRYFVAVAEELHFGRAARRMYVTQQALSQSIKKLEEQLGVMLFVRTSRRVELTDAGRDLVPHALRLIAVAEELAAAMRRVTTGGAPLRIGTVRHADVLGPVLDEYRALVGRGGSAVDVVQIVDLTSDEQVGALTRGEIDVALAHVSSVPDDVSAVVIRFDPVLALVQAGMRLGHRDVVPAHQVVVVHSPEEAMWASWHRYLDAWLARHSDSVSVTLNDITMVPSQEQIAKAGLRGKGVLTVPAYRWMYEAGVRFLPVEGEQAYFSWAVLTCKRNTDPRVAGVVEAAARVSARLRWLDGDPGLPGEPWLPDYDPFRADLSRLQAAWSAARSA
jgi:DNA-binding transcriptional LysR family regulator